MGSLHSLFINIKNGMSVYFRLDCEPAESCVCHVWHCWNLIKCTAIVLSKIKCSSGKHLPLGSVLSSWANRSTAALTAAFQPQPREQQMVLLPEDNHFAVTSCENIRACVYFLHGQVQYPENSHKEDCRTTGWEVDAAQRKPWRLSPCA